MANPSVLTSRKRIKTMISMLLTVSAHSNAWRRDDRDEEFKAPVLAHRSLLSAQNTHAHITEKSLEPINLARSWHRGFMCKNKCFSVDQQEIKITSKMHYYLFDSSNYLHTYLLSCQSPTFLKAWQSSTPPCFLITMVMYTVGTQCWFATSLPTWEPAFKWLPIRVIL